MSGAPTPQTLLEAIANSAASGGSPGDKTNPMPESPTGTNAASIQGGFPAITMTNEEAGGKPPLGQDMNGFMFLVSSHTLYVECGQLYLYNSDLATAISGYKVGTILGMSDGSGMWLNITGGNTTNPDTGGAGWVPMAAYGFANITGLTGGTRILSANESKLGIIVLNGVLTSNLTVILPQTKQQWLVVNRTSGAFTSTVKTAAGGSVGQVVGQGGFTSPLGVYSIGDGNIYPTVAPLSVPIDQNPTPSTIVERSNTGAVLATYLYATSPTENPTIGHVMVTNNSDQNFLRKIGLTNFEAQLLLQGMGGQLVNGQVPFSVVSQWASALFSSPALTGNPTAPTAATGDSDTSIATTAFANPGVTSNGNGVCIRLPSGYKIQFGTVNPGGGAATITFPVAFTSSVFGPWGVNISGGATQFWLTSAPGLATAAVANTGGSSFWIAVGN